MNFLNKAKEQANNILNNKGGSPMGNPFLNKNTVNNQTAPTAPVAKPGVAPTNIPAPKAPAAPGMKPPSIPGKPGVPPMPGKPGVPPVPKAPVAPKVEEVKEEVKEEIKEVEVVAEAPVVEVEAKTETVTETVEETTEVKEEVVEEKATETAEEKKSTTSKRRSSSRSKAKTSKSTEEVKDAPTVSQEAVEVVVSHTELSYAEACQAVRTHFVDEEWEADKARFEEMSRNIHISGDMNKAQLHDLLAQVSNLRDEMHSAYTATKTLYEHLTDKDNGMIERTKRTGAKGSNSEERKLTSTLAVMNYVDDNGNKINLYEVLDETRIRFNCLKGLMDTIEFKKGVLLTMLSSLKSN